MVRDGYVQQLLEDFSMLQTTAESDIHAAIVRAGGGDWRVDTDDDV